MNELLFCKLISIAIYIYIFACTCINVMSNIIFAPLFSQILTLLLDGGKVLDSIECMCRLPIRK